MDNNYIEDAFDSLQEDSDNDDDCNAGEGLAAAAYTLMEGQAVKGAIKLVGDSIDRANESTKEFNAERQKLVTGAADDIAKSIGAGPLTKEAQKKIEDTFEKANYLGNEQEVVKAINAKLKAAGSTYQISLEHPRQPGDEMRVVGSDWTEDRKVTITDTSNNRIKDSHSFDVYVSGTGMPPPSLFHLMLAKPKK